ncbi:MAG: cytochrome c biogenesis protein [Planctomycetota bacterium]|jgi:cytochrome c-type biogenesis protein CcsB
MENAEVIFFWITVLIYIVSFCFHLFGFISGRKGGVKFALTILWAGLAIHTATGILRWIAGGHPPVTDTYELNLTGMWFVVLIFLVFESMRKADRATGLVVVPIAILVLGHGIMSRTDAVPMGPSFQSLWLAVHVIFAWLAFGCYLISTGASALLLLKERRSAWDPLKKVPPTEKLDLMSYRFIVLGFINHAVMLVSGAIWAKKLWGRYWSWDALETWSLIAFLFYAFYLHARAFLKWKMQRAAWLAVIGLIVVAISFWGVEWFAPTIHPGP